MKLSQLKTTTGKNKKKSVNPLTKKWQAIQRQINQIADHKKKVEAFSVEFAKRMQAKETAFVNKRGDLVEHFCGFIAKKTVKDNALDQLMDYIDEEMHLISNHPYTDIALPQHLLKIKMRKYQERMDKFSVDPKYIESLKAYLDSYHWLEHDFSDEELSEFIKDPDKVDEFIENERQKYIEENNIDEEDLEDLDLDGPDDFFDEDMNDEELLDAMFKEMFGEDIFGEEKYNKEDSEFHEYEPTQGLEDGDNLLKKLMKSEEINKVYKKLANLLHPDKLQDKSKQAEYLSAMKELIAARKAKDMFGLLSLAQRYMPDHELALDKEQEKQLAEALNRKLAALQNEFRERQNGNDYETVIWNKFHSKNKRQQEANLEAHEKWLIAMNKETDHIIATTSNIKNLKSYLRDFYQRRDFDMMQNIVMPQGFDDFGDGFGDVFRDDDDFPF